MFEDNYRSQCSIIERWNQERQQIINKEYKARHGMAKQWAWCILDEKEKEKK